MAPNVDKYLPSTGVDQINSVQHSQYHGFWCPDQGIRSQDIDYVE